MITLHGADQCQPHTRVTAGGLDDGGARLQDAFLFSILNHGEGDAVLHAAARVKELHFGNERGGETLGL